MAFDSQGQLHVASVFGDEILTIDPESGDLIATLGANQQVVGPDEVAFGPDGSLYWTSFGAGEVCRLAPDGTRTAQFVGRGVNPLTFSDDGRLFVATDFMGDALYELDPELVEPPRLVREGLGFLNGMEFGPDGLLYGPLWSTGEIVSIDVSSGDVVTVSDGFLVPAAVAFDSHGGLYAVDHGAGRVLEIDPGTGKQEVLATLIPGLDHLVFDSLDRLFVSNGHDGSITEVLRDAPPRTVCCRGMVVPGGVAVLPREDGESVFVADFWCLREYDGLTGKELSFECHQMGKRGKIATSFTLSPDGENLIISSWLMRDVVQVYDPWNHKVLEDFRDVDEPLNAIRFGGDLVVAERGTRSVVRLSATGPERRIVMAEDIAVPAGLAADDKNLWVTDWEGGTVLQVVADGKTLPMPMVVASGLARPEGLAVDLDGSLLVVESEIGQLSRIDRSTGSVSPVANGLARCLQADHPTWIFNGVAVGPSGAIYLTNDTDNTLYRIDMEG
jgi:sugar lactone lactonase YvrE